MENNYWQRSQNNLFNPSASIQWIPQWMTKDQLLNTTPRHSQDFTITQQPWQQKQISYQPVTPFQQQPPQRQQPQTPTTQQRITQQTQQPQQQQKAPTSQQPSYSFETPQAWLATPDVYEEQAQQAQQRWDTGTANVLNNFASTIRNADTRHQRLNEWFQNLGAMLNPSNQQYVWLMQTIDEDTKNFLNQQKWLFDKQFWPWGELVTNLKDMGQNLTNYLRTKNAEEQALAQAQAWEAGVDPAQLSSTLAWLESKQLEDTLKVQQAQQEQLRNLYGVYQNLLNNYQQQYAGSTDKNVVQTYKDLLNQTNQLKTARMDANNQLNTVQQQRAYATQAAQSQPQQQQNQWWILWQIQQAFSNNQQSQNNAW